MGIQRGAFENIRLGVNATQRDALTARIPEVSPSAGLRWAVKAKRIEAKYAGAESRFYAAAANGVANTVNAVMSVWGACAGAASGLEAESVSAMSAIRQYENDVNSGKKAFNANEYAQLMGVGKKAMENKNSSFNVMFRATTGRNAFGNKTPTTSEEAVQSFLGSSDGESVGWGSVEAKKAFRASIAKDVDMKTTIGDITQKALPTIGSSTDDDEYKLQYGYK